MRRILFLAALAPLVAGCMTSETAETAPRGAQQTAAKPVDHDTLAFVQAACGGCHALQDNELSPNPHAPRWVDIANREELTEETMVSWLLDAHNYPDVMDFDLEPKQAEMVADYLMTLRSDDYKRMPD